MVDYFTPMNWSIADVRRAIPPRLFRRDTGRSLMYFYRDVAMALLVWKFGTQIDAISFHSGLMDHVGVSCCYMLKYFLWAIYWWFQGLVFTGIWVIGHECGHGAFSEKAWICDTIGFVTHSLLWTPYFSWKISHHRHHNSHASMENDEVYVPWTRSELNIAQLEPAHEGVDYELYFGDTPLYTLLKLIAQQLFAFQAYLLFNVSGQRKYPKWTCHYDPNAVIYTKDQRRAVLFSNAGLIFMAYAVYAASCKFGFAAVAKYYGIPWLCVHHWFVMITYLHHTDPALPHYRSKEWTFSRGAAATMDRNFLGWMGNFFLHGVAHYHVIHHFFPKMPFYHGPEATIYLKKFLGDHYHYSEKAVFKALWDNYNNCQFVEDTGDILFYRDTKGASSRVAVSEIGPSRESAVDD